MVVRLVCEAETEVPVMLTGNCSKFFANDESREDAESVVKAVLFREVHTQEIMLRCVGKLNLYFILILINFFHPGKQGTSSFQLRLPCWQRCPKNCTCMVCLHFTASWQYHGSHRALPGAQQLSGINAAQQPLGGASVLLH